MPAAHVWNPTEGIVERANVARFMRATGSPLTMNWSVARPPTSPGSGRRWSTILAFSSSGLMTHC